MKIAIVASKLGLVCRGFESFTRNTFDCIKNDIDITLFKGKGTSAEKEVVPRYLRFDKGVFSLIPLSQLKKKMYQERSYALGMIPYLLSNRYDVIHFSEIVLGKALFRIRRLLKHKFVLLYSNGAPAPPLFYHMFDAIQELTPFYAEEAIKYGISAKRIHVLPYSIYTEKFAPVTTEEKKVLRRKFALPEDKQIILTVAAIKKEHKRIDYLIKEISHLDHNKYYLLVVGERTDETSEIENLGRRLLGDNFKTLTVPYEEMPKIYKLSDLFVLSSVREAFGNVLLEAMAARLPVMAHRGEPFNWVLNCDNALVDMSIPGSVASKVLFFDSNEEITKKCTEKNYRNVISRFDVSTLKKSYLDMYKSANTLLHD